LGFSTKGSNWQKASVTAFGNIDELLLYLQCGECLAANWARYLANIVIADRRHQFLHSIHGSQQELLRSRSSVTGTMAWPDILLIHFPEFLGHYPESERLPRFPMVSGRSKAVKTLAASIREEGHTIGQIEISLCCGT
jgi:hypothetical protein